MEQQRSNRGKKVVRLLSSRGFYILLALGLAVVGVSGYVSNTQREIEEINNYSKVNQQAPTEEELAAVYTAPVEKAAPEKPPVATPEPTMPVKQTPEPTPGQPSEEQTAETAAKVEPPRLMLPLQGEMTLEFSGDNLVYSKTMEDWRVHSGIDIRGEVGSQVKAAADGVVTSAQQQDLTGFTVVIEHEGGLQTVYANLQQNQLVKEGQTVEQGQVIGGVGATASFEIADAPHLHFEVKQDNVCKNPFDFMD